MEDGGGVGTVLLADDEAGVRAVIRMVLSLAGYAVLEAGDGEEALRVAEDHSGPIDLLLADVEMPTLGGRELASRLAESRPGLRVLFLSGHPAPAAPGLPYLQKPFTADTLARKVREVLGT